MQLSNIFFQMENSGTEAERSHQDTERVREAGPGPEREL